MVAYAGLFESDEKARTAFESLNKQGLDADNMLLLTSTSDLHEVLKSDQGREFLSGIEGRVHDARAEGKSFVIARPPIGMGDRAIGLLETSGAEKVFEADVKKTKFLSEVFGLPLITSRKNVQTGTPTIKGHITGGLLTKKSTSHMSGGLLTKKSTTHVAGGSVTKKGGSHITGGLVSKDGTHIMGFFPLVTSSQKSK